MNPKTTSATCSSLVSWDLFGFLAESELYSLTYAAVRSCRAQKAPSEKLYLKVKTAHTKLLLTAQFLKELGSVRTMYRIKALSVAMTPAGHDSATAPGTALGSLQGGGDNSSK